MLKIKNRPFYFKREPRIAYLVLNKSHSNLFLTLCDERHRVIKSLTAGMVKLGRRKKQKIAPQTIENMVHAINPYFVLYEIKRIVIILKIKPSAHLHLLVKELLLLDIVIHAFLVRRCIPHNGMRQRKVRRV